MQYLNSARIDPWNGNVPTIITESRSLAGVLRSMCRDYRIRVASTNGQCAGFLHTKLVKLLEQGGRIGYLGDSTCRAATSKTTPARCWKSSLAIWTGNGWR